ncbi:MAG: HAMP domain-containing histidine kinase [Clostridia bacterium]|nr:HAMP domain-containing histidine kinase [Clostridia bacterium]
MKKIGITVIGFFLFFITLAVTSTASIFVYYFIHKSTNSTTAVVFGVLGTIIAGAILCSLCDLLRRKKMVEKPVDEILAATHRIAKGDFSVKLKPKHEFTKFDEYDYIFENINIMTSELAKNEMLKNDFVSNVSHEIKTPLAVIQNYAKLLQSKNLKEEKREEYLKGLSNQSQKLTTLVHNILKLNKLENQSLRPELEKINLSQLLEDSLLTHEGAIEAKGLKLVCDVDEIVINANESYIETIINNLISNAIKFTDKGTIEVKLKDEKDFIVYTVKDEGCGISKETGERIFDKFYQGDTSHSGEGNGLGLALVKKIIDLIGGEIAIESKVGVGSTFTVRLKKEKNV